MYHRVLLKISGEALSSEQSVICRDTVLSTVAKIKAVRDKGVEIGIVVGGGNIMRLQKQHTKINKPALDLASLILACRDSGWSDEQAYRSSKSISEVSAKRISERRRAAAQAYQPHREQVRSWLAKHWGKVMDIRRAGLSWRRVAAVLAADHGITVSHTTLHSYWRRLNERF